MKNLLFLLLLTSCVTPKKAVDVLSRPKNEPVSAEFCAAKYPVIPTVDSSAYLKSKATVDSLIAAFDSTSETYANQVRQLMEDMENLRQVPKTDWYLLSQKLSQYATLLEKRNDSLEKQNKKLTNAVKDVKPVKETKPDLAKESVLNSQIAKLNEANRVLSEKNAEISQQRDGYKSQRDKWRLRFFILLFTVGLAYSLKVKMTKKLL